MHKIWQDSSHFSGNPTISISQILTSLFHVVYCVVVAVVLGSKHLSIYSSLYSFIKKRNLIECLTHTRYLKALRVQDKTYHLAGHVQPLFDVSLTHQIVSSIISYSRCSFCHPEVLDCKYSGCLLTVHGPIIAMFQNKHLGHFGLTYVSGSGSLSITSFYYQTTSNQYCVPLPLRF